MTTEAGQLLNKLNHIDMDACLFGPINPGEISGLQGFGLRILKEERARLQAELDEERMREIERQRTRR